MLEGYDEGWELVKDIDYQRKAVIFTTFQQAKQWKESIDPSATLLKGYPPNIPKDAKIGDYMIMDDDAFSSRGFSIFTKQAGDTWSRHDWSRDGGLAKLSIEQKHQLDQWRCSKFNPPTEFGPSGWLDPK